MLDLYHASRDDLITLVLAQREALAERDQRVAALEGEVATLLATVAQVTVRVGELLAAGNPDDNWAPRIDVSSCLATKARRGRR